MLIPLADLNTELQLSNQSLDLFPDCARTRYSSSGTGSHHASLHSSLNDVHLLPAQFSFEDSYERDCNVTELTYENSGLDIDTYKAYLHKSSLHNDSCSDSGICDPANSEKGGSSATRTPTNSPISANTGGKNSPGTFINSQSRAVCVVLAKD